jgi:PAS domain S-box-containing protein
LKDLYDEDRNLPDRSHAPRILVFEDDASGAEVIGTRLAEEGMLCEVVHVDSAEALRASLREGDIDVIIADHAVRGRDLHEVADEIGSHTTLIVTSSAYGGVEAVDGPAGVRATKSGPEKLLPAVIRALHGKDEDYRAMFEFDRSGRVLADPGTGAILRVNPGACGITGYSEDELLAMTLADLAHPEDAAVSSERFLALARGESSGYSAEQRYVREDGEIVWVSVDAAPARHGDGLVWGVVATIKNITDNKRVEDDTLRSASLTSSSPIPTVETSCAGQPTFINPAARRRFPDLAAMGPRHPILSGLASVATEIEDSGGRTFTSEVSVDGSLYERLVLAVPGGDLMHIYATDITDRRRAEEALKRSEERFRSLVRYAADIIMILDADGVILYESPAVERVLGFRSGERTGTDSFSQVHPDDLPMAREMFAALLAQPGQRRSVELRTRARDGGWRSFEAVGTNLLDDPVINGVVVNARDVTERRRAEGELRNSEERFRWALEQAAENIFVVDPENKRILDANVTLQRSLGYTLEDLKDMTIYDFVAHDKESVDQNTERIVAEGSVLVGERKYKHKDGSLIDVEVNAGAVPYGDGQAICVVAHDITARKRTETALRQNLSVLLALREAGQVLNSTLESDEIVARLLEIMRSVAGLTAAVVTRYDENGKLRVWRSAGLDNLWPRVRYTREAENARRTVLESEEQQIFRLQRPWFDDQYLVGHCLPIRVRNRTVGVLEAYGKESLAHHEMLQIISSLTSQAAAALENASLYETLGSRERALQDLVKRLLGAQEEERRRVSYEVHDGLAQVAVAAHQNLQAFARRHPPQTEQGRKELDTILQQVRATVSDARRVIANLRPTALDDLGLAAAISLEVERLKDEGYFVDFDERLGNERLPKEMEITLFRVAQEALTNVLKHADTQRVGIELIRRNSEICLAVQDFGSGFDPAALETLGGGPGERVGLAGMRERVNMLGGEFEIESRPGEGALIVATIPLERAT